AERALAFDLLGVPAFERELHPALPESARVDDLKALTQREVEALTHKVDEDLADLDDTEQALASEGLGFDIRPPARLLRRYEASCRHMLFWGLSQLMRSHRTRHGTAIGSGSDRVGSPDSMLAQLSAAR